ncbi:MAG: hypothetical protein DLM60_08195 [Pseudonocardiales bacterium]|nr:MAG: hypothetical protein DLM60_08195 [Pseudonocardiales bacterium]
MAFPFVIALDIYSYWMLKIITSLIVDILKDRTLFLGGPKWRFHGQGRKEAAPHTEYEAHFSQHAVSALADTV